MAFVEVQYINLRSSTSQQNNSIRYALQLSLDMASPPQVRKWYQIRWFKEEDTPEERKLIVKLDLLIVPYVFLAYWVKYIDQANISKAVLPVSSQ